MADSELGEVRRPQRADIERLLRATGYRSQGMAGGTTDTVSPLDESDDSGLAADLSGGDDGDETPAWFAETKDVTEDTTWVLLTYAPVEFSEVLRLNGVTMVRGVDYSVSQRTVTLLDPADLLAGIGGDTWTIEATYPYTDAVVEEPAITETIASDYVNPGLNEATLPSAVTAGQIALLIAGGNLTGFTGGFATWTKIWGGSTTGEVALWLGTGVGTGTTITHTDTGSATDDAQFVLAVFDDVTGGVEVRDADTVTLVATDDPAVTPTLAVTPGELVICAMRGENSGTDSYHPDTSATDTGFTGTYLRSYKGVFYGQGVAMSIGFATEDAVSSSIDVVVTGTAAGGQAATIAMAVDW
jgi:hypothetical protein